MIAKYILRIAVAVPFIIALGFGIAALTVKLIAMYGDATAYAILAGAFGAIGLVAAAANAAAGSRPGVVNDAPAQPEESPVATEAAEQSPLNPDLLMTALGVVGPRAIPAIPVMLRFVVKNWALVISIAILSYLMLSERSGAQRAAEAEAEAGG